jgi:hypothetical protein
MKSVLDKAIQVRAAVNPTLAHTILVKVDPVRTTLAHTIPVKAGPVRTTLVRAILVRAIPVTRDPIPIGLIKGAVSVATASITSVHKGRRLRPAPFS